MARPGKAVTATVLHSVAAMAAVMASTLSAHVTDTVAVRILEPRAVRGMSDALLGDIIYTDCLFFRGRHVRSPALSNRIRSEGC